MPLYEYECDVCRHRFEVIQKFSDAPIEKCPACGGAVHKMQSAPAFHLKGTGWYATDYAKSGAGGDSKGGKDGRDGKKSEGASGSADSSSSGDKPASGDTGSTTPSTSTGPASTGSSTGASSKPETPKT